MRDGGVDGLVGGGHALHASIDAGDGAPYLAVAVLNVVDRLIGFAVILVGHGRFHDLVDAAVRGALDPGDFCGDCWRADL